MANKKILPGLTTRTPGKWKNKVREIDELGLKEIALFPTSLNAEERRELYDLLEKTGLKKIPHVHLRDDMKLEELDYLTNKYGTEVFNVHSENDFYKSTRDYKNYFEKIYVENTVSNTPTENDLKRYAGLCFDLSHWQALVLSEGENGSENIKLKKFGQEHKIGCNHIAAVKPEKIHYYDKSSKQDFYSYDSHDLADLSELDYVKKYKDYLADIISIELENPLKRQLEVKKYLEKILDLS
ncbi:MAG: hypothetical protein WCV70_03000 [Patescibacteria group bacterium]|jgi:hypothetical protein